MPAPTFLSDALRLQWQGTKTWFPGAVQNNPVATTVLADTGALEGGTYLFHVFSWQDGAAVGHVQVEHRNAANSAIVTNANGNADAQRRAIGAGGNDDFVFGNGIVISTNERVRVTVVANITGNVQCGILAVQTVTSP